MTKLIKLHEVKKENWKSMQHSLRDLVRRSMAVSAQPLAWYSVYNSVRDSVLDSVWAPAQDSVWDYPL